MDWIMVRNVASAITRSMMNNLRRIAFNCCDDDCWKIWMELGVRFKSIGLTKMSFSLHDLMYRCPNVSLVPYEPTENKPSMVAPDQGKPSELLLQKPREIVLCSSVPESESCTREPSMVVPN
ncbi:hypothetical protein BLOT_012826 [Blomia tropicalis]|nr:hypothetical protein BLOT_012826 [Blomia tropicalis]